MPAYPAAACRRINRGKQGMQGTLAGGEGSGRSAHDDICGKARREWFVGCIRGAGGKAARDVRLPSVMFCVGALPHDKR